MSTKRKAAVPAGVDSTQLRGKTQRTALSNLDSEEDVFVSLSQGGAVTRKGTAYGDGFQPFGKAGRKLSREEEVEWLSQLNRRFEIIALARQAQEQAIIAQIQDTKTDEKSLKFELETMAKAYSTVLSQQQTHINNLSNNATTNDSVLADLKNEIGALKLQLKKANDAKRANDGELQTFRVKYETVTDQLETARDSIENLQEALDKAIADNQDMVDQINDEWSEDEEEEEGESDEDEDEDGEGKKQSKKSKKAQKKSKSPHARRKADQVHKASLEAQVKLLEKQLEVERQHFKDENLKNKEAFKKANQAKNDLADQLSSDFQARLDEALQEQEEQHQLALEDLARDLAKDNSAHKKKLADQLAQQKDLNASQKELNAQLQETKTALDEELASFRADLIEAQAENDALVQQNDLLREEYQDQVYLHSVDLNSYQDHLESLVEAYRIKELEFEELMSVKVGLQLEIQQYSDILNDADSDKPKTQSTPTRRSSRRKAAMDDEEEPKKKKGEEGKGGDNTAKIVKTGIDFNGAFVKFTNGSAKNVSFEGYTIGSDKDDQANHFAFDGKDCVLTPSQQLIIYFQPPSQDQIDAAETAGHIVYDLSEETIFEVDDESDKTGILSDKFGRSLIQFDFVSKGHKAAVPTQKKKPAVGTPSKSKSSKKSASRK